MCSPWNSHKHCRGNGLFLVLIKRAPGRTAFRHHTQSPSRRTALCTLQRWTPMQLKSPLLPFTHTLVGPLSGISMAQQHPTHQSPHLLPAPVFLGSWSKGKEKMIQPWIYVYPAGGISLNMENRASKVPKKWATGLTEECWIHHSQWGKLVPQKRFLQDAEE